MPHEYAKKYGFKNSSHVLPLANAFDDLETEGYNRIKYLTEAIFDARKEPEFFVDRYGPYVDTVLQQEASIFFGSVLEMPDEVKGVYHYVSDKFQSMKNHKISSLLLKTGETHVSIGSVDFAQLLFTEFVGDLDERTHFNGVDLSIVSITRCKVLYEMLRNQASGSPLAGRITL